MNCGAWEYFLVHWNMSFHSDRHCFSHTDHRLDTVSEVSFLPCFLFPSCLSHENTFQNWHTMSLRWLLINVLRKADWVRKPGDLTSTSWLLFWANYLTYYFQFLHLWNSNDNNIVAGIFKLVFQALLLTALYRNFYINPLKCILNPKNVFYVTIHLFIGMCWLF